MEWQNELYILEMGGIGSFVEKIISAIQKIIKGIINFFKNLFGMGKKRGETLDKVENKTEKTFKEIDKKLSKDPSINTEKAKQVEGYESDMAKFKELEDQIETTKDSISYYQKENKDLKNEIKKMEYESEKLQVKLDDASARKISDSNEVIELKSKIDELRGKISRISSMSDPMDIMKVIDSDRASNYEKNLKDILLEIEIEQRKGNLDDLNKKELERLRKKNISSLEAISNLKNSIKKIENEFTLESIKKVKSSYVKIKGLTRFKEFAIDPEVRSSVLIRFIREADAKVASFSIATGTRLSDEIRKDSKEFNRSIDEAIDVIEDAVLDLDGDSFEVPKISSRNSPIHREIYHKIRRQKVDTTEYQQVSLLNYKEMGIVNSDLLSILKNVSRNASKRISKLNDKVRRINKNELDSTGLATLSKVEKELSILNKEIHDYIKELTVLSNDYTSCIATISRVAQLMNKVLA